MRSSDCNEPSSTESSSDSEEEMLEDQLKKIGAMVNKVANKFVPIMKKAMQKKKRKSVPRAKRDTEKGYHQLYNDYFSENAVYNSRQFRRRFRMQKYVFLRIMNGVVEYDPWFQQKPNAAGILGISPLQKCTAALRQLAYGCASDAMDEYLRISDTAAKEALYRFVEAFVAKFGDEYLRKPNQDDLDRLLRVGEERGFPGMIGSIDCMHWEWKNCPVAWRGQYQGREGVATVVLEAVADRDLWIWHSFFGMPGSCNDINVVHRSPVFDEVLEGRSADVNCEVNDQQYNKAYYLTDGIYPRWSTFVKSITSPQTPKESLFAKTQEAARKDVERAFGVLQARFAMVRRPMLSWDRNDIHNIMTACIIMHNMIVEDERHTYQNYTDVSDFDGPSRARSDAGGSQENEPFQYHRDRVVNIFQYLENRASIEHQQTHMALKYDLIEYIWAKFGPNRN